MFTPPPRDPDHTSLGAFLRGRRAEILQLWFGAIRDCTGASRLSDEELLDHTPLLFDRLADAVDAIEANRWSAIPTEGAQRHAVTRLASGFDLKEVVTELFLLRHVLVEHLRKHREPADGRAHEAVTLGWAVDSAIRESVEAYTQARQRLLEALDRLSSAALGSTSLDELLPRLLHVVKDFSDEVDTAVLFTADGDRLTVRASLGMAPHLERGFSVSTGEGLAGRVAAERRAVELRSASEDPSLRGPVLGGLGLRGVYGLPLLVEGRLVGVLHVGSRSVPEFSETEKVLLRSIAERAACALEYHRTRTQAQDSARAAEEAAALVEGIFAGAPLGCAFLDRDLRYVRVNPALAEMNGLPVPAHLGLRVTELFPDIPGIREIEARWRRTLETGAPETDVELAGRTFAQPHVHRTWRSNWYPVRVRGEVAGLALMTRDVTKEKEGEEFRRKIMGIVGHDLRSPLAAIRISAEILAREGGLTDRQSRGVARILSGAGRMERITRDLLDVTRIQAGQAMALQRGTADLGAAIRRIRDEAEAANPGRAVQMECAGELRGEWDGARLEQAIGNLVANALVHGARDAPVRVRCFADGDAVGVEVENRGEPIAPELLPHLFEPFRRGGRTDGRRGGLGLGLFIVSEIVRAHGGTVAVTSDETSTVFRLRLPRGTDDARGDASRPVGGEAAQ